MEEQNKPRVRLGMGFKDIPEVEPHILTIGELRAFLKNLPEDMPVAIWGDDGYSIMVERMEIRAVKEDGDISSWDQEEDEDVRALLMMGRLSYE